MLQARASIWSSCDFHYSVQRDNMKIQEHTPEGVIERELTDAEVLNFAEMGSKEAQKEIQKKSFAAKSDKDKITTIAEFLGLG